MAWYMLFTSPPAAQDSTHTYTYTAYMPQSEIEQDRAEHVVSAVSTLSAVVRKYMHSGQYSQGVQYNAIIRERERKRKREREREKERKRECSQRCRFVSLLFLLQETIHTTNSMSIQANLFDHMSSKQSFILPHLRKKLWDLPLS